MLSESAALIQKLPTGADWIKHLQTELMPFWMMDDALGTPLGNFPTSRCNDGRVVDPANPCPEFRNVALPLQGDLHREYTRTRSRQTFAYGVAYHLMGEERFLKLARAGVDFLREHAYEKGTGSAVSYWANGVPGPAVFQRTSQDLSYAQVGLAFYYYLTRDEEVLKDLVRLKDHIFRHYYQPQWDLLMWVKEDAAGDVRTPGETEWKELVAQLDQINAYMLLLTPLLPDPLQQQWKNDLRRLVQSTLQQFYSEEQNLFWGAIHDEADKVLGSHHTDFGHTAKAFWLTYLVGRLLGEEEWTAFAGRGGSRLLDQAYLSHSGSWGSKLLPGGEVEENKEWWIYCELDQIAATLALEDPSLARYLVNCYRYWFKYFVDHEHHEVWHMLEAPDDRPALPKAHLWKNGFHSTEHALVGYLTAQALRGQPVVLYYAFQGEPEDVTIQPYYYRGRIDSRESTAFRQFPGHQRVTITFTDVS